MTETRQNPVVARAITARKPLRLSWRSVLSSALVLAAALLLSNPNQVLHRLSEVDLVWLAPAFVVACFQLMLLGLRWSKISRAVGLRLGFARATLEYALSVAVNLVLPSGFAGDGLRAYRHSKVAPESGALRIVEALALDRISGQLALGLVVLVGVPLGLTRKLVDLRSMGLALVSLLALVALGFFVVRRIRRWEQLRASLGRLLVRAAGVLFAPRNLLWHLPLSLLFTAASVTELYIASRALGAPFAIGELFWAGPLILLAAALPSFFGGWGIREGASGLLFAALNLPPSTGVAVSVVYGAFGLVVHLPGLLVLALDYRAPASAASTEGGR